MDCWSDRAFWLSSLQHSWNVSPFLPSYKLRRIKLFQFSSMYLIASRNTRTVNFKKRVMYIKTSIHVKVYTPSVSISSCLEFLKQKYYSGRFDYWILLDLSFLIHYFTMIWYFHNGFVIFIHIFIFYFCFNCRCSIKCNCSFM